MPSSGYNINAGKLCERGGMADALGSGPSGCNARGGSSPLARTRKDAVPGKQPGTCFFSADHFTITNRSRGRSGRGY